MEHYNAMSTTTKVEAPLGIDMNVPEAKRDWYNSYASVIVVMFYLSSNTRPGILFSFHQCT